MTATPVSPASRTTEQSGPGDTLVRIGGVLFAIGAVATVVTMMPLFLGTHPLPTVAYLVCMLMAAGFVVAAAGVLTSISAQRRLARETAPAGGPAARPGTAAGEERATATGTTAS